MNEASELRPEVFVLLNDALPPEFETEIAEEMAADGFAAPVLRIPGGPFLGLELYLPTAIGLFILSSYFGGMLQHAGGQHFDALKRAAKSIYARASRLGVSTIASAGKVNRIQKFSLNFSITGAIQPGLSFKLVLSTEITKEDAERGIAAFLNLIRDLHDERLDDETIKALLSYRPVGGLVLVTFDCAEGRIVPVDPAG